MIIGENNTTQLTSTNKGNAIKVVSISKDKTIKEFGDSNNRINEVDIIDVVNSRSVKISF